MSHFSSSKATGRTAEGEGKRELGFEKKKVSIHRRLWTFKMMLMMMTAAKVFIPPSVGFSNRHECRLE